MKRLFYFTGYRLSVLYWKGKELVGSSSFEPTREGLDNFRNYLLQTENISGMFFVDVIEEDFRNEKIPHVSNKDRQSVIGRLIDRYYRASQDYCYNEVIGREKSGRKDDIVLLGAMTNPQLIQPWLNILDECEVPLSGIWTLPIVSKKLLKTLMATDGCVLLVSQQVNSNVRQTLFRDGKLVSSRQSIVNQDINDISNIGELAEPEVNRTVEFLRAQNLVSSGEVINLHILGSAEQLDSLQRSFKPNDFQTITIHLITDIQDKLGLKGVGGKFSDVIFAWLCSHQSVVFSHYGPRQIFSRYQNKIVAMALNVASIFVVVTGVLLTELNVSEALEYEKSITFLKQEESNYKNLYSKKFKDFEDVFQNAGIMNAAVQLANQIKINSETSPLDFLIKLSDMLHLEKGDELHIDQIEWKAININEQLSTTASANFTANIPVKHSAIVTGRIDDPEHDYRESIDHIERIINYLKTNAGIEDVVVLKMPVDLRSESKFSTESGVDISQRATKESSGVFTLKVIMKAANNV
ncbi:hypothetical protein MNBD_GAMMA05-1848 [hydrothermal vent metagenome]|uniref:Uncharacterized protein n=1 Tax=hydrothermal vent metagenome TaxID=652676 RepID=A0A3B0WHT4_9ZZZZ